MQILEEINSIKDIRPNEIIILKKNNNIKQYFEKDKIIKDRDGFQYYLDAIGCEADTIRYLLRKFRKKMGARGNLYKFPFLVFFDNFKDVVPEKEKIKFYNEIEQEYLKDTYISLIIKEN